MTFSTPVNIPPSDINIDSKSKLLTIGSCFSDNIGGFLDTHRFDSLVNPFGTVFNPISLSRLLERALNGNLVQGSEIDNHGERFFHFDFHSSFDSTNPEFVIKAINESINSTSSYLDDTDVTIITLGTCVAYHKTSDNQLVSNCHKVPNKLFDRRLLPVKEMVSSLSKTINQILAERPDLKIITTVSPVRHTKEGLIDNQRSKSRLIETCHQLADKFPGLEYFPSYEIMVDELRDYRFYNSDFIHPSPLAVDIIWKRFINTYFSEAAKTKVNDISKMNRAVNHRPFDVNSIGHHKFCIAQLEEIERLQKIYPEVSFEKYQESFKS